MEISISERPRSVPGAPRECPGSVPERPGSVPECLWSVPGTSPERLGSALRRTRALQQRLGNEKAEPHAKLLAIHAVCLAERPRRDKRLAQYLQQFSRKSRPVIANFNAQRPLIPLGAERRMVV